MKRPILFAALLAALLTLTTPGVQPASSVEIKVRPKTPTTQKAPTEKKTPSTSEPVVSPKKTEPEDEPAPASMAEPDVSQKKSGPKDESAPVSSAPKNVSSKPSEKKVEREASSPKEPDVEPSSEKKSAPDSGASSAYSSPLKRLSDEDREKLFPKVQGAALMTIESLVPTKDLHNVRVLRALTRIPRVDFVPRKLRAAAYNDEEIPLDSSFRASRPFDVAYELEALDPQETDKVLVVETGSGYHAAVLSFLAAEVYVIGSDRNAVKRAYDVCKKHKYANVSFKVGAPAEGRTESGPYDKIVVTRAVEAIPDALVAQLKDGGKLVAPVGDRYRQLVTLGVKKGESFETSPLIPVRVDLLENVPLERTLPKPSLIGGGFEELDPEPAKLGAEETAQEPTEDEEKTAETQEIAILKRGATPVGWYDAWNFQVLSRGDAYEGSMACLFSNEGIANDHKKRDRNEERVRAATLPEERVEKTDVSETIKKAQRERELCSQARQSFAIDGSDVRKATVSGAYRASSLTSRRDRQSAQIATLEFFDKNRKSLGEVSIADVPLSPSSWQEFSTDVSVPARAKEATLTIGLLDGIGTIEIDGLEVKDKFAK